MKRELLDDLRAARRAKRPTALVTDLTSGRQALIASDHARGDLPLSAADRRAVMVALERDASGMTTLAESGGNIVNVASQSGLKGLSHLSAYSAAKGGLVMLTRALAVELAPRNVRVNCVCPGAVLTGIAETMDVGEAFDQEAAAAMMQRNPTISPPEDIARAIVFLASPDAASATGAVLPVDGGATA